MEAAPHILVVDDHRDIREPLASYLEKNGFRASAAADAREARQVISRAAIDLVVLDIMMPGEDGLSLCRHLRESTDIPVILLSARTEETDRVVGLEIGADDYVSKPFAPRELLARIKSVLRRVHSLPPGRPDTMAATVEFDGWRLDLARRQLTDPGGVVISLSAAEFALLDAFQSHPGMVLSRDQLLDLTQGREASVFDRSIDNLVSRLRKKVEADPRNPLLIKTVRGGGYVFTGVVERI